MCSSSNATLDRYLRRWRMKIESHMSAIFIDAIGFHWENGNNSLEWAVIDLIFKQDWISKLIMYKKKLIVNLAEKTVLFPQSLTTNTINFPESGYWFNPASKPKTMKKWTSRAQSRNKTITQSTLDGKCYDLHGENETRCIERILPSTFIRRTNEPLERWEKRRTLYMCMTHVLFRKWWISNEAKTNWINFFFRTHERFLALLKKAVDLQVPFETRQSFFSVFWICIHSFYHYGTGYSIWKTKNSHWNHIWRWSISMDSQSPGRITWRKSVWKIFLQR